METSNKDGSHGYPYKEGCSVAIPKTRGASTPTTGGGPCKPAHLLGMAARTTPYVGYTNHPFISGWLLSSPSLDSLLFLAFSWLMVFF
jgi:hypothetical protein